MIDASALHCFAQALGPRRNKTAAQRARILTALRQAGPSGMLSSDLAAVCGVPCITKRVSELRRMGYPIGGGLQARTVPDGTLSPQACYVLDDSPSNQQDLFTP